MGDVLETGLRFLHLLQRAFARAIEHDCLNTAQAAAYSAMVSLFPALIVSAAVVTLLPDAAPIRTQAAMFFDRILPDDVSPVLDSYFENGHQTAHSTRALVLAAVVSLVGASSVIVTLMEGFRRAFNLRRTGGDSGVAGGARSRWCPLRSFPLSVASVMVIFGHHASAWIAAAFGAEARGAVYLLRSWCAGPSL